MLKRITLYRLFLYLLVILPKLLHFFSVLINSSMKQNHVRKFIYKLDSFFSFLCFYSFYENIRYIWARSFFRQFYK